MNRSRAALVLAMLTALLSMGTAPWRSLPECLIGKWSGITPVDEQGNPTGPADLSDWGCVGSTGTTGTAVTTRGQGGVPSQPPTDFCLYPPFPNPASPATRLIVAVPRAARVRLAIYAKKGNGPHNARLVRTLFD